MVPADAKSVVPVVVETRAGRTAPLTIMVTTRGEASALEPDVALPGQTILLRGLAFSGKVVVLVAGMPAKSIEGTADGVRAVIPDVGLPEGVKTNVTVQTGTAPARTFDLVIGRLPLVQGVKPATGPVGETVTLRGRGFAAERRGNRVTFAGQPALVVAATPTELKVVVPPPSTGDVQTEMPDRRDGRRAARPRPPRCSSSPAARRRASGPASSALRSPSTRARTSPSSRRSSARCCCWPAGPAGPEPPTARSPPPRR